MNDTMPIIRVEIEGVRLSMHHAFSQSQLKMDEMMKSAIDRACHPDRIQATLDEAADRYIRTATDEAIKQYFLFGDGRKEVQKLVESKLKDKP